MNKTLIISIIAIITSAIGGNAQTRFRIDTEVAAIAAEDINTTAAKIARTLKKRWRKANSQLTENQKDAILARTEILVANRYMPQPDYEDTTILNLVAANKPVGLIMLTAEDAALAMAYVNEASGVEYIINPSHAGSEVAKQMRRGDTYVIAGVNQPGKLFFGQSGRESMIDLTTGETSAYDYSTLPDYVYTGTMQHRTGAVIGSVLGGGVTVAVIALAALL